MSQMRSACGPSLRIEPTSEDSGVNVAIPDLFPTLNRPSFRERGLRQDSTEAVEGTWAILEALSIFSWMP